MRHDIVIELKKPAAFISMALKVAKVGGLQSQGVKG
jgi:hypothetical protein